MKLIARLAREATCIRSSAAAKLLREAADAHTEQEEQIAELMAHVIDLVAERDAAETQCADAERELNEAWKELGLEK